MEYVELTAERISPALFAGFIRRQTVTLCRRKTGGEFRVVSDPFIDDWDARDHARLCVDLIRTARDGGLVLVALDGGVMKGFASVDDRPLGSRGQYLDLTHIHVSADRRGMGVGRQLFSRAMDWAGERGAEKLYISAHSALESQAFYAAMGCGEAEEYCPAHVEKEPCDCQMECVIQPRPVTVNRTLRI